MEKFFKVFVLHFKFQYRLLKIVAAIYTQINDTFIINSIYRMKSSKICRFNIKFMCSKSNFPTAYVYLYRD